MERTDKEALSIMNIVRNTSIDDFPLTDEAKELGEFLKTEMKKHKEKLAEKEANLNFALDLVYDEFSNVRLLARAEVKKLWKEVFGEDVKVLW